MRLAVSTPVFSSLIVQLNSMIIAVSECKSTDSCSIHTLQAHFTFCTTLCIWKRALRHMYTTKMSIGGGFVGSAVSNYSGGYGFFNRTNDTAATADPCLYCWVVIPFYLVIIAIHIVVLCLVVSAKAVSCSIRFVLANILVASIIAGLGTCMMIFTRGILAVAQHLSPSDGLCRFLIVVTSVGGSGRTMFMAVFAFVVCVIIKYSSRTVKLGYLVICASMVWLMCIGFHSGLFAPDVLQVLLADNYAGCIIRPVHYRQAYTTPYLVLFALFPFTVTVTMPTAAYCCIKANTARESKLTIRPLVKFALFLLLGNLLSCMGHATPVVAAAIDEGSHSVEVVRHTMRSFGILIALSLIPTPILVLVYFQPIRYQMRKFTRRIWRKIRCMPSMSITTWRDLSTEMMLAEVKKAEQ